jgi:hypothetical protein
MSHHQANLEPLDIFELILTVLFVSKAYGSAAFATKRTVIKNLKMSSGPKYA